MKQLCLVSLVALILLSCKKDNDKEPPCGMNVNSISGKYKFIAYTYKASPSSNEVDYFSTLFTDACERDNEITFHNNGNWILNDAGTQCAPPISDNGTWSVSGNSMNVDGDPSLIASFDCKELVLITTDIEIVGYQLKIKLLRQ